ncbi:receptor-like protein EIX2 [Corylus avellana]|uniref:receptor-like protein EIX2 n=1 Tax=Corylus avellana TaxID=13451 RepID=UPI00286AA04A|nr:receptor-like protein EIX2 [Corylus avellana]
MVISSHIFMSTLHHLILIFFISLLGTSSYLQLIKPVSCTKSPIFKCSEVERKALLSFKYNLTDPSGRLSSWVGEDCCNWLGVGCDNNTGNVVKLDLRNPSWFDGFDQYNKSCLGGGNNLIGKIPNSFANLCNLQALQLRGNNINGGITEFVDGLSQCSNSSSEDGNLPSMQEIDLSFNQLNGTIPESIGKLSMLVSLNLNDNQMSGTIPESIGKLSMLVSLNLAHNQMSGTIPESIGKLSMLVSLNLADNQMSGTIPESIGKLSMLVSLNLADNQMSGTIPESIGKLSMLVSLNLAHNQMSGTIPESIGKLSMLVSLNLADNQMSGTIPESIGKLSMLVSLNLADNQMSGTIPESIGKLSMLVSLKLGGENSWEGGKNSWEGVLTEAHFLNLTRLKSLSLYMESSANWKLVLNAKQDWVPPFKLIDLQLRYVRIGPTFPTWLTTQNELNLLLLENAGISDTIPHGLWKSCPNITFWSLSNNKLRGQVPYFEFQPSAYYIDLSFNNLEGPLPLFHSNLRHIHLDNNMFSGPIPKNIGQLLPNLDWLDLSSNSITGRIPHSFGMLKNLSFLILRNNSVSGKLPPLLWKDLQRLLILDLAENNISGNVPSSMQYLRSLEVLSLSQNHLDGEFPSFFRNYSNLQSLDLGRNKFFGKLPTWLGESLPHLLRLRLRSNFFQGDIPQQLCLLSHLQILDLAHNDFSGVIPKCLGSLRSNEHEGYYVDYDYEMLLVSKGIEYGYGQTFFNLVYSIDLSSNNLSGEIPDNITSISELVIMNLSMNHLIGRIPNKIGNLQMLQSLDLSMNELYGPIPQSLSSLNFLSRLNLSFNNLSGKIPNGDQLQTLNDASIYEGNSLLCGLPLSTKCLEDETKHMVPPNGGNRVANENGSAGINSFSFYVSMMAGFIVGFWGVCSTLIIKTSWRQAYFRSFDNLKDKIVVFVMVKIVCLLRKESERN